MAKTIQKHVKRDAVSTQEKIKAAAHKVFLSKGYAAATTRDVAEEAGINLALVNYYFRSKKNLFEMVMQEKIQFLLGTIFPIISDASSSLDQKIEGIANAYIDFLTKNPDLPTFILNELRKNDFDFISKTGIDQVLKKSPFIQQLKGESRNINPVHFLISLLAMTIFPFVARPILMKTGLVDESSFQKLMNERRTLIPAWIKAMRSMTYKPIAV
ncbi:MAG TPA: TetR/AcrR family transcriptional regulator [Cyclobacteriaceae bacterium]|nr:TetR/AcrR family transcriptional regulator [Cyclobacteriaceae bacterium]